MSGINAFRHVLAHADVAARSAAQAPAAPLGIGPRAFDDHIPPTMAHQWLERAGSPDHAPMRAADDAASTARSASELLQRLTE